ncbi:MAG: sulfotransferase [Devosia sp.]|uniref:sulfotransferase n=1 Tax=unclassified Devosia TaxID=196773 RepID=UPI000925B80B|nr:MULTISPECIES: sulfotransferase [unclassified Devosia]MBL8596585.1 sulfotransferase [Devosia sp.]MBN9348152.1 sulfotransferase [Devosia sp.]OJX51374.1 MAG: hypothetical protein BGO81_11890 [Devosia sp. 66-22]
MPSVVVLGCGRSGTSIFGELFDALPQYSYLFEPSLSDLAAADDLSRPLATKGPRHHDEARHRDGLAFALPELFDILPAPRRIYWMVRHPLDCISSLRPGIAANWSHVPRPANWRDLQSEPLVIQCAAHWAHINSAGYAQIADRARVVRYEDVVAGPMSVATQILADLGLADDADAAHAVAIWAARVNDNPGIDEAARQTHWLTTDHSVHVGRWRENLSAAEVAAVRHLIDAPARSFGYLL